MKECLIQAEFFLVDTRKPGQTLEGLMRQCAERQSEGMPIKAVVRFYDHDGQVTSQVKRWAELERIHEELVQHTSATKNGVLRWVLDVSSRRVARARAKAKEECVRCARQRLYEVIRRAEPVAVEKRDHRFRDMRGDEKYELLESVGRSSAAWIFVFARNELLSDSNELVARMM